MFRMIIATTTALFLTATVGFAENLDCSLPANAASAECTGLGDTPEISNLALVRTGLAVVAVIALLSGGDDTSSTVSTTSQ